MGSKTQKFASVMGGIANKQEVVSKTSVVLQSIVEGNRPDYQYLNIDNIQYNPQNDYSASDSQQSLVDLANDIRMNGLLHNIVVSYTNRGEYRLLSGERRLRAYHYLRETTDDKKYDEIYALVRKDLSELDEMLILDAANLQTRGSLSDERRFRKATVRFIENIKQRFGLEDALAVSLAKQYMPVSDVVVDKNLLIERGLNKTLLEFFDSGLLSKVQAYEYARLTDELQVMIAENLTAAYSVSHAEFKNANAQTFETVVARKKAEEVATAHAEQKAAVDAEISEIEEKLAMQEDEPDEELLETKAALERQSAMFNEEHNKAKEAVKARETALAEAPKTQESDVATELLAVVRKGLKKMESGIQSFDKKANRDRIHSLDKADRQDVRDRIQSCVGQLERLLESVREDD